MLNDTANANYLYRWQNNSLATVGLDWMARVIHSGVSAEH